MAMKTNEIGESLIESYEDMYDPAETREDAIKAIRLFVTRRLTSNQFSALIPLIMHIGIDDFKASKMLKLINSGRIFEAADQFNFYIYAEVKSRRKADPFLVKQREMEKKLFLMPEVVGGTG